MWRRFAQFVELHAELRSQHLAAMNASGALLPNKFRLPSSLQTEGEQRMAPLQAYFSRLLSSHVLRQSEPLMRFVDAHHHPERRRMWAEGALGRAAGPSG